MKNAIITVGFMVMGLIAGIMLRKLSPEVAKACNEWLNVNVMTILVVLVIMIIVVLAIVMVCESYRKKQEQ